MYLIIVNYKDDPERKRVEYVLEKWKETVNLTKPDGIVALVEGSEDEISRLAEELYSKTSRDSLSLYKVEKTAVEVKMTEKELRRKLNEKKETVAIQLEFIMARQRATLKWESSEGLERTYEVLSKKGKAEISVQLREKDGITDLRLIVSGYGEVVDFIYDKLKDEVNYLGGQP